MDPILPNLMQFADPSFGYLAVGPAGSDPPRLQSPRFTWSRLKTRSLRKIERCEAIALSFGRKSQQISSDGRFFNMKMTMFGLVLAIGMAFSAFAADEPKEIKLEGVIQQLPPGQLFGIWMVSRRAIFVSEATVIEEEDGPVRVGAKVDVKGFVQPDGSITATNIETDE
jgi:hypothetical protein